MPIKSKRPRSGDSALHSNNASSSSENKTSRWSFGRFGRKGSGSGSSISGRSISSSNQSKNNTSPLSASAVRIPTQTTSTGGEQPSSSFVNPTQPWAGYQIEEPSYLPFANGGQCQIPSVIGSECLSEYAKLQDGHLNTSSQRNALESTTNNSYYTTSRPSKATHHSSMHISVEHSTNYIGSDFIRSTLPPVQSHAYMVKTSFQQPMEAHSMYSEVSSPSQITVCESGPTTPSVMASYNSAPWIRSTFDGHSDWMKNAKGQTLTSNAEGTQLLSTPAAYQSAGYQIARLPLIDQDTLHETRYINTAPSTSMWMNTSQSYHPANAPPMNESTPQSSESNNPTSHESDRFYRNDERQSSNCSQPSRQASTHTSYSSDSIAAEDEMFAGKGSAGIDKNATQAPSMQSERRQYSSVFQVQPLHDLSQYEPLETLGTGTFGRVLLVRLRSGSRTDPKNYFALKVLNKMDIIRLKQITHTNNERDILSKVHHPFIVDLYCTYQDEKNCYMLMEYVVGGEVFSHLRKARRFTVDVTRFYISCLILALAHLHSEKILYRDLKPENLLLDRQGYIKIADFGFAKSLRNSERTWTLCGTPEYLSPEVIQSQGQSFASDYWALGILMYEMLCGFPPFYDKTPFGTYEKILQANIVFPKHVDACSRDLIQSLLNRDVTKRLGNLSGGANDVIRHPWFEGVDWQALLAKRIPAPIVPVQTHAGDSANFQKYDAFDIAKMPALQKHTSATNMQSTKRSSSEDYIQSQFRDF